MNIKKHVLIVFIICASVGTAVDLVTKHLAVKYLLYHPWIIIPDVFSFRFVTNENMIWGLPLLPKTLALIIPVLAIPVIIYIFLTMKPQSVFSALTFGLILSGTIGNLADRMFYKNARGINAVRDFISVDWINWPVFNMADVFICVGAVLLAVKVLFAPPQAKEEGGKTKEEEWTKS